jgi:mono/diheme cytochrome c family protein
MFRRLEIYRKSALTSSLLLAAAHIACGEDAAALWSRKVQPLFDVQCVKCHGPIEQKSGLELDTPQAALKGGDSGSVVVAGKPEESALFKNLAAGADPHMPPKKQLSDAEREIVREWIAALAAGPQTAEQKAPRQFASVSQAIDSILTETWVRRGVKPAPPVNDSAWCRRVYLDLAGRIPTPAERDEFLNSPAESRRAALVDRLLASNEYPARMRELWDVFLMGRGKRGNNEERRKQNGWWEFLEMAFRTNRPWNETVRELLVARPARPEDKGASWFLFERRNEHQAIAEAVAPIVYGTKIDCAQCHDHPLAREIKQAHYWGLVAAFNRSKNVEGTNSVASWRSAASSISPTSRRNRSPLSSLSSRAGRSRRRGPRATRRRTTARTSMWTALQRCGCRSTHAAKPLQTSRLARIRSSHELS